MRLTKRQVKPRIHVLKELAKRIECSRGIFTGKGRGQFKPNFRFCVRCRLRDHCRLAVDGWRRDSLVGRHHLWRIRLSRSRHPKVIGALESPLDGVWRRAASDYQSFGAWNHVLWCDNPDGPCHAGSSQGLVEPQAPPQCRELLG